MQLTLSSAGDQGPVHMVFGDLETLVSPVGGALGGSIRLEPGLGTPEDVVLLALNRPFS